jgi:6-phosphogluconolactonase
VYSVDGATGAFKEEQRLADPGKTPWSFALDPSGRWMLVANQGSDQVSVLKVDPRTGALTATPESLAAPKPVVLAFPG